ncbi:TetR/AcrR family transcriptional regulator [Desertivirga xinjiangensis]|uniref:TetR/AcrR family transcriptional regulator n=1 Tax=Desertivirga xinjiangensis TaxID=539206 RepID=UPI002108920F|nr:TetR/AcrR family transcriptional regulator [Pedobacter xinjiangensis]
MARKIAFIPEEKVSEAMNVFWSEGYTAASLSDLTEAMKINKSSLYNSIGDKHTLFKECLQAYYKMVEQDYFIAIRKGKDALEKLDNIIDKIIEVTIERKHTCLGIKSSFELAGEDKEVKGIIKAANEKTMAVIKSLIKEAQVHGDINAERSADIMSQFFFYSFSGLQQSFVIHDGKLVKNIGNELKAYLRS